MMRDVFKSFRIAVSFLAGSILLMGSVGFTPSVKSRGAQVLERKLRRNLNQEYVLQLPSGYNPDERYPLLIAIHAGGGQAKNQCQAWAEQAEKNRFLLLCPQYGEGYHRMANRENVFLMQILLELQEDYPYEEDMIFLAGFDQGAEFVHRYVARHPKNVRAVATFGLREHDDPPGLLRNRQVRFFVGVGEDDVERYRNVYELNQGFQQLLQARGYAAAFQSYPGIGHVFSPEMREDASEFFQGLVVAIRQERARRRQEAEGLKEQQQAYQAEWEEKNKEIQEAEKKKKEYEEQQQTQDRGRKRRRRRPRPRDKR